MPYTLKPNKIYARDTSTGGYLPQNVVADTTTAELVALLQSEGTAQQTAIQNKGTETLATIPADYTALAGEVDDLKSALSEKYTENILAHIINPEEKTASGVKCYAVGKSIKLEGTSTDVANYKLYEGPIPDEITLEKPYNIFFDSGSDNVILQIFGYNSSNSAYTLFEGSGYGVVQFREDYNSKILIRIRITASGVTINRAIDPQITHATNQQLEAMRKELLNDVVDFKGIETVTVNGLTFTVNKDNRSIIVNGTATRNTQFFLSKRFGGYEKAKVSGGASGGGSATYNLALYYGGSRVTYFTDSMETDVELDSEKLYTVQIVIFSGVTMNNVLFTPRCYVSGRIMDIEETIESIGGIVENCVSRYMWYQGTAFVCQCGDKVFIDTKSFRVFDRKSGTYTSSKNGSDVLANDATTVKYIDFDGTNFSRSASLSDRSIAVIADRYVTPLIDGVIANYRAIQDGYIRSGSNYCINYDRTPIDAIGDYGSPTVKIGRRAYLYQTPGTKKYDIKDQALSFTLTENAVNIDNKKILIIGDSFVARGYIQNWLHLFNNTLEFIGTKTTQNYGYKSEGVSGSRLYYFIDPSTSPFYFNGALDFSEYLSTNQLDAPDYIIINSAINHSQYYNSTWGTYLQNVKDLVNMIHAYNANIKVYVTFGANYATEPGSVYGYPSDRYIEVRKCCNSVYAVDGITVIPVDYCLVDELDYPYQTYSYFGQDIQLLSDCVHPNESTGFKKIAMMIYNFLGT